MRTLVVLALLTGHAGAEPAPAPRIARAELESIQASVEAAVAAVSRPAGLMFGRPSRAYHLKGYGAIVVLAPRALPRLRRHAVRGPQARAFADVIGQLERGIEDVREPAERRRLEETLAALRNWLPPAQPVLWKGRDIESLQEEAEAFRREAERAMEKAERDVLVRLRVAEDAFPALAPAPARAPVPPVPLPPVDVLVAPAAPVLPAPPGWPFWFGEDEDDTPPERIFVDVRRAIVSGLGAHRGSLGMLGADESVVVAVDFVPGMAEGSGARTVVARARKRDLTDHRAGRLSAAALQSRVEFDEY